MRIPCTLIAVGAGLILASAVNAEPAAPSITLTLKNHRFSPDAVTVPAGQRIRVELINQDGAAEEFDSEDLHAEKQVAPHGKAVFQIGPLKPGVYGFMGELHADTAQGKVTAVAAP